MTDNQIRRLVFGSTEWVETLAKGISAKVAEMPSFPDFTLCEVYHDAPEALSPSGQIGWTIRIRSGVVSVEHAECSDEEATKKSIGDYSALKVAAMMVIDDSNFDDYRNYLEKLKFDGLFQKIKDTQSGREDYSMHNSIASITC